MEGVILFADDHVLEKDFENGLFNALSKEKIHPVLPIVNLDLLEISIISTSSIKALIVDWNFENIESEFIDAGVPPENETPYSKLMELDIFSLIYVYSEKPGLELTEEGLKLKERFKEKIEFRTKDKSGNIEERIIAEKNKILLDLAEMYKKSDNIQLPIKWSQVINQSVQGIFSELNTIDKKWISDLYKTAKDDGVEPSVEVINLFQYLLAERVIQSKSLREAIVATVCVEDITQPEQYAKLFRTFLYGGLNIIDDPIMTGDIFLLRENKYGILITPECDISKLLKKPDENNFEFLTFTKSEFQQFEYISQFKKSKDKIQKLIKGLDAGIKDNINSSLDEIKTDLLNQAFNQPHQRLYLLPCFEFETGNYKATAQIDFRDCLEFSKVKDAKPESRICKLNSPYIQDLRQRFLGYKGRVGVPSFPDKLRGWLLNN